MADYLLDTSILRYWYNTKCPEHPRVVAAVNLAKQPDPQTRYISRLFVSVVTLGEIEYGHRYVSALDPITRTKQAEYAKFIREQCPEALDLTRHVAEQYGQLKAWVFNACQPKSGWSKKKRAEQLEYPATGEELQIDENDLWIAAQAMTHNLVLVTHDRKGNFGKVLAQFSTSLRVEDWAE